MPSLRHHRRRSATGTTAQALAAAALSFSLASAPLLAPASAFAAESAPAAEQKDQTGASAPLAVTMLDSGAGDEKTQRYPLVEISNPGSKPITIGEDGLQLSYITEDSADTKDDTALTVDKPVTVEPDDSIVLWLTEQKDDAATADPQAEQKQAAELKKFKDAWELDDRTQAVQASGLKDDIGESFGVRVSNPDGSEVTRGFTDSTPSASEASEEPTEPSEPTESDKPSPTEDPSPSESPSESAEPSEDPTDEPTDKPKAAARASDDHLGDLLITELVPDSANKNGADAYEFIEIYNPTSAAINLRDYQLHYLYLLDDRSITNSAEWPMEPDDTVIEPGKTVVAWVKNGANDDLSAQDFADHYKVNLKDFDLVEIHSAGMSNTGLRGMELRTLTGEKIHRVDYNVGGEKDTAADIGIHYAVKDDDRGTGTILEKSPATPGSVSKDQVPGEPVEVPKDDEAPVIKDTSPKTLNPDEDAKLTFAISDNVQVRRVELELSSNADSEPQTHNLTVGEDGKYTFTIPKADLFGKKYFEYTVTAGDGANEASTKKKRVDVEGADTDPLRLNVEDGQFVRGTVPISIASDKPGEDLGICVDDTTIGDTHRSLEKAPSFAFETSQTDTFFRNGVLVDGEELHIFDEGTYSEWETVSTDIPLNYVTAGKPLQVDIAAGTKAAPGPDPNENNDDFVVRNVRLVLPDGRTLRAPKWDDPKKLIQMGDSPGKVEVLEALFTIPDDAYNAQSAQWDSTSVEDGKHVVCGTGADGSKVERTIRVDNTAPAIATSVDDGEEKRGEFTVDYSADDSGSGLEKIDATLDGEPVENGAKFSSVTMPAGTHTLEITAEDKVGNVSKRSLTFTTPVEQPNGEVSTAAGAELNVCTPDSLTAKVSDPSGDDLSVSFHEGHKASLKNGALKGVSGTAHDADQADRSGNPLKADESTASDSALPFHAFSTPVPKDSGKDALIRVAWEGKTDPGARVRLLVWNTAEGGYEEVDHQLTDKKSGDGKLDAMVPLKDHDVDGEIRAVVQHSEGWAGPNLSSRDSNAKSYHKDDTPRSDYDFTFAWETDTQYYNESYFDHQLEIHKYLLDQRKPKNIQYFFHTGDIVDKAEQQFQWDNANKAYSMLDDADYPYGVLAGNHDVGHKSNDFTEYWKNFGDDRFAGKPWFGGTHQNNRGHYDLVTAGGHDFIMLYMGWEPGDEQIAWMNDVLKKYPERTAIINLHEYMLTTGGLGPIPQRIYDEVITPNPNVRAVMSGHYHDAYTRVDRFDDNGDGKRDRTVTQMLFDYQALPEGGQGFLRLMHFDNKDGDVKVRTFSPSLKQYDADDPTLEPEHQEFTISYDDLGLKNTKKSLTTSSARVDVLTNDELGSVRKVTSGSEAKISVKGLDDGEHTVYVLTTDPYGAQHYSALQTVTVKGGDCLIEKPEGPGTDVDPNQPDKPGTPDKPGKPAGSMSGAQAGGDVQGGSASGAASGTVPASGPGQKAGAGDASAASAGGHGHNGTLPRTGVDVGSALIAASLLIMAGTAVVCLQRRKRS